MHLFSSHSIQVSHTLIHIYILLLLYTFLYKTAEHARTKSIMSNNNGTNEELLGNGLIVITGERFYGQHIVELLRQCGVDITFNTSAAPPANDTAQAAPSANITTRAGSSADDTTQIASPTDTATQNIVSDVATPPLPLPDQIIVDAKKLKEKLPYKMQRGSGTGPGPAELKGG